MTTDTLTDHYGVLGVPPDSDHDTIRKAYRKLAMLRHPDRGGSHAQMVELITAWEILSDPVRRAHYDAARRQPEDNQTQSVARHETHAAEVQATSYPASWKDFAEWQQGIFTEIGQTKNATPKFMFQLAGFMVASLVIYGPALEYSTNHFPDSLAATLLNGLAILVSVGIGVLSGTVVYNLAAQVFPGLAKTHPGKDTSTQNQPQTGWRLSIGLCASAIGFAMMPLSGYLPLNEDGKTLLMGIGLLLLLGGLVVYLIEKNVAWVKTESRLNHSAEFSAHRSKWTMIWVAVTVSVLGLLVWTVTHL